MADLTFTIEMKSNGEAVLKNISGTYDSLKAAAQAANPSLGETSSVMELLRLKGLGANRVAGLLAGSLTGFGPAGNIAANALFSIAAGAGVAGAAIGTASAGVAFLIQKFQEAQEKKKNFDDALRSSDMGILTREIKAADDALSKLSKSIDDVERRIAASREAGVRGDSFLEGLLSGRKKSASDLSVDREKLIAERQKLIAQSAGEATLALEFETAAIGANRVELAELAHELRITQQLKQGLTDAFFDASVALRDKTIEQIFKDENKALGTQVKLLQERARAAAFDITGRGRGAISESQQLFGVEFDIEKQIKGFNLGKIFTSSFNALKDDPGERANLRSMFQSLVQQSLQGGVVDPQELLLRQGLSSMNLERLKSSLPAGLKAAFDATIQIGDQWGKSFEDKFTKFITAAQNAGQSLLQIENPLKRITDSLTKDYALKISNNAALDGLDEVNNALNQLFVNILAAPKLVIAAEFAASPARPFSEFLPYMQKNFASLDQMIQSATPEIIFNVPNFSSRLRQLNALEAKQQEFWWISQTHQGTSGSPNPRPFREDFARAADRLSPQIDDLRFALQADLFRASQAGGGAGGGGGGGVVVNIDLRGSAITPATLDDNIIPALERGIIRATGQDPKFRIMN